MRKKDTDTFIQFYHSPLGELVMSSDGSELTGLGLASQQSALEVSADARPQEKALPIFRETVRWLDSYFRGRAPSFTPKLKLSGSDFQKRVCEIMLTIPFGKTITYGEIAAQIARERGISRMSAQAVGGSGGSKSDFDNCSVSPGNRCGRQPHRLRRRHRAKNPAAKTRKSRYDEAVCAQEKLGSKETVATRQSAPSP